MQNPTPTPVPLFSYQRARASLALALTLALVLLTTQIIAPARLHADGTPLQEPRPSTSAASHPFEVSGALGLGLSYLAGFQNQSGTAIGLRVAYRPTATLELGVSGSFFPNLRFSPSSAALPGASLVLDGWLADLSFHPFLPADSPTLTHAPDFRSLRPLSLGVTLGLLRYAFLAAPSNPLFSDLQNRSFSFFCAALGLRVAYDFAYSDRLAWGPEVRITSALASREVLLQTLVLAVMHFTL